MDYTWHYDSPLGGITLGSDGTSLVGLWFDSQKYFADALSGEHEEKMLPVFEDTCRWLDIYFSGREPGFTPKLALRAAPFRHARPDRASSVISSEPPSRHARPSLSCPTRSGIFCHF